MPKVIPGPNGSPERIARRFHTFLRSEVRQGNPHLPPQEQALLRGHYPVMMHPENFSPELVATIYSRRRAPAVQAVLETERPLVFDAGCGFGSESFLFASLGARVVAADLSPWQISIARKRQKYYEEIFARPLAITFEVADLDCYTPALSNLSLTWIASVLAALEDQAAFMRRLHEKTSIGGKIIITDMNLLNPLFLWKEWRRRRAALVESPAFRCNANFWAMFKRKGRKGARYFVCEDGRLFDDVQFFSPQTLRSLLSSAGFLVSSLSFHGFIPPALYGFWKCRSETALGKLPFLRYCGYFYTLNASKSSNH